MECVHTLSVDEFQLCLQTYIALPTKLLDVFNCTYGVFNHADKDIPGIGPIHFVRKPLMIDMKWIYFCLPLPLPPHASYSKQMLILILAVGIKDSWAHQNFQRAHRYLKRPLEILNHKCIWVGHGPLQGPMVTLGYEYPCVYLPLMLMPWAVLQ